jgi:hypothetical protein
MKKSRSGMCHFELEGKVYLCLFGGTGSLSSANHSKADYIPWRENPNWGWTNEVHFFDTITNEWITPAISGESPPPCAGFTLTKVSTNSAVFYGGYEPKRHCIDDVYIITATPETVHWIKLKRNSYFPAPRQDHTTVCISSSSIGQSSTVLLVIGGRDAKGNTLGDCWLLDVEKMIWTQINLPKSLMNRHFHSTAVIPLSMTSAIIVLFGGIREWLWDKSSRQQPALGGTVVLGIYLTTAGEWIVKVLITEAETAPSIDYFQFIASQSSSNVEKEVYDDNEEEENDDNEDEPCTAAVEFSTTELDELSTIVEEEPPKPLEEEVIQITKTSSLVDELDTASLSGGVVLRDDIPSNDQKGVIYTDLSDISSLLNYKRSTVTELNRQLIIARGHREEVEEVLHQAVINAENRAVTAEERGRAAEVKIMQLNSQIQMLESTLKESKEKIAELRGDALEFSNQIVMLEKQVLDSETRAIDAEILLNEMQAKYEQDLEAVNNKPIEPPQIIEMHDEGSFNSNEDNNVNHSDIMRLHQSVLHHPNVSFSSDDKNVLIAHPVSSFLTLQGHINQNGTMSKNDIIFTVTDIVHGVQHVGNGSLRLYLNIPLDSSSIILEPNKKSEKKWNAKIITSLASEKLDVSDLKDLEFTDNWKLSLLIIEMATGMNDVTTLDSIDNAISLISSSCVVDLIKLCLDSGNTLNDVMHFLNTVNFN